MLKGFKEFITTGSVIDLAVAFVIGAAFTVIVKSLVSDVITPAIAAVVGAPNSSSIMAGPIRIGSFLDAVISFLLVPLAIYFFVVAPMNKSKSKAAATLPP
ncbi:MAG: large conductance mechanosensitive channel [Myxococcota bacterium]|jgi:large conductance mechanosensitive channel